MKLLKLNIQLFAHHKGQGSTSNGRDSAGRRLGAKAADGEFIKAGSIIYRQRGTKIYNRSSCYKLSISSFSSKSTSSRVTSV